MRTAADPPETLYQLSVIVCTCDHADTLLNFALPSLVTQQVPFGFRYETIIIDNASSDNTKDRVLAFIQENPLFVVRYVYEPRRGLSNARNRGIAEAGGQFIAFLDDDAAAEGNWVINIYDGYRKHPDAWAVGGKTLPECLEHKPRWFEGRMLRFVGGHDLGLQERLLPKKLYLQGSNMSFRRQAFSEFGLFRTDLGRTGNKKLSHEEGEFFWRLHKKNASIYYLPSAVVIHYQDPARFGFKNLANSVFLLGLCESAVDLLHFRSLYVAAKTSKKSLMSLASIILFPWYLLRRKWADLYYLQLNTILGFGYLWASTIQLIRGPILRQTK